MEETALASLAEIFARRKLGIAMAEIIKNDGHHNQQFNQRKTAFPLLPFVLVFVPAFPDACANSLNRNRRELN